MNTLKIKNIIFFLLAGIMLSAQAQTVPDSSGIVATSLPDSYGKTHISASIGTDSITVGDQLTLHIKVSAPDRHNILLPALENISSGYVEALESSIDTTFSKDGEVQEITQTLTITSFEPGHHAINYAVGLETPQGIVLLAPHDSLILNVYYAADADTVKCETRGDVAYLKEPLTFMEIAHWIAYLLLVAVIVFAALLLIWQRKGHSPLSLLPKAKPVPADKRALNELESLRRKELWQKGRVKKYYTDMTDIVRRFLYNMYGISAGEMTSRQTLRAFHSIADWSEENESLLHQLLHKADMVKFAKSQPEAHEHDQAMQLAVDFVRSVAEQHRINNPESEEKK